MKQFKNFSKIIFLLFFMIVVFSPTVFAQAEEEMEGLGPLLSEAATQYLQPVVPALSACLNSGWFSSMPPRKKLAFTFEFGLAAIGTEIGEGAQSLNVPGRYYFSRAMAEEFTESINDQPAIRDQVIDQLLSEGVTLSMEGGTVIGGNQNITLHFGENDEVNFVLRHADYPFPVYVNLETEPFEVEAGGALSVFPGLPFALPQLKLGTLFGTQVILRGTPPIEIDEEVGDFQFMGFGLMHNPMVWLPKILPVQAAVGGMWQSMTVGDHLDIKTASIAGMVGYQLGKRWIRLTPQLGFMTDQTTLDFNYTESIEVPGGEEEITIDMSLEQETANRTFVGLHLYLLHLNLYGRYFMSGEKGVAAGLSVSF